MSFRLCDRCRWTPHHSQRSSVIINDAGDAATRFRQTAKGSELARAEAGDVRLHAPDDAAKAARNTVDASEAAEKLVPEITSTRSQLQHAFKHAGDFGISGNANNKTITEFNAAIQNHIAASGTQAIQGTYRGHAVTHFLDASTGLNVVRDSSGGFLSGWKLSPKQLEHVTTTGNLGGG